MTEEQIKFLLSEDNNEVLDAHKEIVAMQNNKDNILRLGDDWIDDNLIGGLNNKMCFFGSRPSNGKTFHCSQSINNLLNKDINSIPIKIARFNLEMPTQSLMLQELSKTLKRSLKDILSRPFIEEEKPIVRQIVNSFRDKRVKNISKVLQANDFRQFMLSFLAEIDAEDKKKNDKALNELLEKATTEEEEDEVIKNFTPVKTKKIALIDHLMIYKNKDDIDSILLVCNELKMLDKNLSFIIYFQLRRDIEDMWRETKDRKVNPRNILPNSTFIYQTDILQQIADIVVGMVIPQIYELEEFATVYKEHNEHLREHFIDGGSDNKFVKLKGRNRIYYNFMKVRLLNSFDDPRLFCNVLNPDYEEKAEKLYKENKEPYLGTPTVTPVFERETLPPPNFDLKNAFPSDDERPF